jgi:hypothetical protein
VAYIESGSILWLAHGNTEAEVILQYLNEILDTCQNAGLKVAVTVCDMVVNKVKSLKLLGATQRKPFFRFHNDEIVRVCDSLHPKPIQEV